CCQARAQSGMSALDNFVYARSDWLGALTSSHAISSRRNASSSSLYFSRIGADPIVAGHVANWRANRGPRVRDLHASSRASASGLRQEEAAGERAAAGGGDRDLGMAGHLAVAGNAAELGDGLVQEAVAVQTAGGQ